MEDYISKPIGSCPMQFFPHFHWICLEGKRPLIPENFIRDETKNNFQSVHSIFICFIPEKSETKMSIDIQTNNNDNLDLNSDNLL